MQKSSFLKYEDCCLKESFRSPWEIPIEWRLKWGGGCKMVSLRLVGSFRTHDHWRTKRYINKPQSSPGGRFTFDIWLWFMVYNGCGRCLRDGGKNLSICIDHVLHFRLLIRSWYFTTHSCSDTVVIHLYEHIYGQMHEMYYFFQNVRKESYYRGQNTL